MIETRLNYSVWKLEPKKLFPFIWEFFPLTLLSEVFFLPKSFSSFRFNQNILELFSSNKKHFDWKRGFHLLSRKVFERPRCRSPPSRSSSDKSLICPEQPSYVDVDYIPNFFGSSVSQLFRMQIKSALARRLSAEIHFANYFTLSLNCCSCQW